MAAALGRFGENKNILIHVKFDRYKENNKDINQSTITWAFDIHLRCTIFVCVLFTSHVDLVIIRTE